MSAEEATVDTSGKLLRVADNGAIAKVSQTCNRRYSEVMREYLRRKQKRDGIIDDKNIKPSEVLTHQADHTGPNGCSYVRWDNPDTPGMMALNTTRISVHEELCQRSENQEVQCSPKFLPGSPLSPESATESYDTAKTHFSNPSPFPLSRKTNICLSSSPTSRLSVPDPKHCMAKDYLLPLEDRSSLTSAESHPLNQRKAPIITVCSANGSFKRVFATPSVGVNDVYFSKTFTVDVNRIRNLEGPSVTAETESEKSEVSVMRDTAQDHHGKLIHPMALDFNEDSFMDSDLSQSEEALGELYYPPGELQGSTYSLRPMSPSPKENEGSTLFSCWPSNRRRNNASLSRSAVTARRQKVKRLQRLGLGFVITGIAVLVTSVVVYVVLVYA